MVVNSVPVSRIENYGYTNRGVGTQNFLRGPLLWIPVPSLWITTPMYNREIDRSR